MANNLNFDGQQTLAKNGAPDSSHEVLEAAISILEQGRILLRNLTAEDYSRRLPAAFNATIGGHFRHCLDHFVSIQRSLRNCVVNYDQRDRDQKIETDQEHALNQTHRLVKLFQTVDIELLNSPVITVCKVNHCSSETQSAPSTLRRELMYAVAHAVHHFALIAVMANIMDIGIPGEFGIAPSTLVHQNEAVA